MRRPTTIPLVALLILVPMMLAPGGSSSGEPDPDVGGASPAICLDQIPPWALDGYCQGNIPPIILCPFGADGFRVETTPIDIGVPFPCIKL